MTPTAGNDQTITIRAEGKLPGEELAVKILDVVQDFRKTLSPDLRAKYDAMLIEDMQFWHDLFAPLRNLAARLQSAAKP